MIVVQIIAIYKNASGRVQLIFTLWIQISFTNFAFVNSAFLTWLQLCGTWHSVWNQLWYLLGSLIRILACVHFTSVQGIWFCLFKNDTLTLQVMEKKERERKREKVNYRNFLSLLDSNPCLLTLIPETEIDIMNSSPI